MNRLPDAVFYDNAPTFARFAMWSCEVDAFGKAVDRYRADIDALDARIGKALMKEARHG